ncbi:MAG TPA: transposase [Burkholderiales bacterium]|nr:transposase [Burkholderiales bacterium]
MQVLKARCGNAFFYNLVSGIAANQPNPLVVARPIAIRPALMCALRYSDCAASISPRSMVIDVGTALKVVAEIGPDFSRFKTVKHFCSWLGLCPGTKISGGKMLSGKSKRTANRVAQALKLAASNLRASQSALGAYYRRMCGRMDKPKAITAAAHKLARLIYALATKGQPYVDQGQDYYEERYQQRVLNNLKRKAQQLGY